MATFEEEFGEHQCSVCGTDCGWCSQEIDRLNLCVSELEAGKAFLRDSYDAAVRAGEDINAEYKRVRDERDEVEEYLPEATGPYQTLGERAKLLKDQMEYAAESSGDLGRAL